MRTQESLCVASESRAGRPRRVALPRKGKAHKEQTRNSWALEASQGCCSSGSTIVVTVVAYRVPRQRGVDQDDAALAAFSVLPILSEARPIEMVTLPDPDGFRIVTEKLYRFEL